MFIGIFKEITQLVIVLDDVFQRSIIVLKGEMTVTDKDGNEYVIHANESISFPPNEGRGLENKSNEVAEMLVIINYPDAK